MVAKVLADHGDADRPLRWRARGPDPLFVLPAAHQAGAQPAVALEKRAIVALLIGKPERLLHAYGFRPLGGADAAEPLRELLQVGGELRARALEVLARLDVHRDPAHRGRPAGLGVV